MFRRRAEQVLTEERRRKGPPCGRGGRGRGQPRGQWDEVGGRGAVAKGGGVAVGGPGWGVGLLGPTAAAATSGTAVVVVLGVFAASAATAGATRGALFGRGCAATPSCVAWKKRAF